MGEGPRRRAGEATEILLKRKVDCCMQESWWKGVGTKILRKQDLRCKFFWQGCRDGRAGVGTLVSAKWIDEVVRREEDK